MNGRRERWGVIADILSAVEQETSDGRPVGPTLIATRANIPYDRLKGYLDELREKRLLEDDPNPRLTPSGREFLRQHRQWAEVLARYGFGKDPSPQGGGTRNPLHPHRSWLP